MKTSTIRQQVTFKASPTEVYEALMDEKKHSRFTGAKASVSRKVGGKFSAWDGYIEGTNLELVPDQKIVQEWRDTDFPAGHFSRATFRLTPVAGGTRLVFTQSGVPVDLADETAQGWQDYYWQPIKKALAT